MEQPQDVVVAQQVDACSHGNDDDGHVHSVTDRTPNVAMQANLSQSSTCSFAFVYHVPH